MVYAVNMLHVIIVGKGGAS